MLFSISAGRRIDFFQLSDGKRRLSRIFTCKVLIKIRQFGLSLLQLRDNQSHLISPVSQMDISCHLISFIAHDSFHALPDDCRAQVSHMQWFGHIRSAVIDQNRLRCFFLLHTKHFILRHLLQKLRYKLRFQFQIDKARFYSFCLLKICVLLQMCNHILRYHKRCFMICLGCCHGTVTLIFTQVRAVGQCHLGIRRIIPCRIKSCFHFFCYQLR